MAEDPKQEQINKLGLNEIDNILDEIESREEKGNQQDVDWKHILEQLRVKNINYIKQLVSSKSINVNDCNPIDNRSLLIYSTIIGSLELVTALCNFGADTKICDNDGMDALQYGLLYFYR